ncbi:uncharacterized protein LOC142345915 [Convolutriloba macropyga]|uniref:uncharacterized protein LOC142345915 n=1 Tax=Convolutriloba macropyga TaxID=536237 RepID=UPI003F51CB60
MRLTLSFSFDVVPGSSYEWTLIATSQGSNPLQRNYTFYNTNPPITPIPLVQAASTLETYNTFVLTIGSELFSEGSTQAVQFKWAQERRVDGYNITDRTMDRHMSHVIADSGWSLHNSIQLTAGRKYTYEIRAVSHGLYSSDVMTIEDSPNPLPPRENSTARVVGAREITMAIEYFGVTQYLIVAVSPPEGNCASVCTYNAPSTTSVHINGLTPGRDYNISLWTESYGKESEPLVIQEQLEPGQITYFLLVVSSNKITVELQLESDAGSEITLEYTGIYTGHTGSQGFPYKLVSRLILENMNPSESYNMTLTLKGEGVNYKRRVKTFQAHLYPSDVVVSNIQAQTHQLKMFYETQGLFSFMEISVSPAENNCPCETTNERHWGTLTTTIVPGSECPCKVLYEDSNGFIVIGHPDSHPLTAGEEYFVTIRTSSFHGLQSSPTFIVKSLPTDRVIRTYNRMEGNWARFEMEFESGLGSFIRLIAKDSGAASESSVTVDQVDVQFSIIVRKDVPISRGMCVHLEVHVYSRGSNPVESRADQPLLMIDPIAPSPDTGVSLEKRMWDEKEDDGVTVKRSVTFSSFIDEGGFEKFFISFSFDGGVTFVVDENSPESLKNWGSYEYYNGIYKLNGRNGDLPDIGEQVPGEMYTELCGKTSPSFYFSEEVIQFF